MEIVAQVTWFKILGFHPINFRLINSIYIIKLLWRTLSARIGNQRTFPYNKYFGNEQSRKLVDDVYRLLLELMDLYLNISTFNLYY